MIHGPQRRKQQPCLLLGFSMLLSLALLSASPFARAETASAQPVDPKIACRTEEIITSLAISPPDKLDFFGEDKGQGNYHCEAYFSYKAYADVWNRVNAMMPKLRKVEAACAASALLKLPKLDALQLQYDITLAGKYRITGAGDLPADPAEAVAEAARADRRTPEDPRARRCRAAPQLRAAGLPAGEIQGHQVNAAQGLSVVAPRNVTVQPVISSQLVKAPVKVMEGEVASGAEGVWLAKRKPRL